MRVVPGGSDARFGAWVSLLYRAARTYFTKALSPYSIGPGQQAYLLVVRPGESVTQQEIADRLSMNKANVTRAVRSLCGAGYFTRTRPARDHRKRSVSLTPEGVRVRSAVERHMIDWVSSIRPDLSEDQWERFVSLLESIAERAMEKACETDAE